MKRLRVTYTITGLLGSFTSDIDVNNPNDEQEIKQTIQSEMDEVLKGTIYERECRKVGNILLIVDYSFVSEAA